jgi:hypothetical protein
LISWIKGITEKITEKKGFSDLWYGRQGGMQGTSSPLIDHPTHPYIKKPLQLQKRLIRYLLNLISKYLVPEEESQHVLIMPANGDMV